MKTFQKIALIFCCVGFFINKSKKAQDDATVNFITINANIIQKNVTSISKNNILSGVCGNNQISELNFLPSNLEYLWCWSNPISNLNNLPSTIIEINCTDTDITLLDNLPLNLKEIRCDKNIENLNEIKKQYPNLIINKEWNINFN